MHLNMYLIFKHMSSSGVLTYFDLSMCLNLLLNELLNHLQSSLISTTENHSITSLD